MRAASNLPSNAPAAISGVGQQQSADAAMLHRKRSALVRAPDARLAELARLDERIAAFLDHTATPDDHGPAGGFTVLDQAGAGEVFVSAVHALEARDRARLDRLIALAPALPDARRGLVSAFGWAPADQLQGIVRRLLTSLHPHERELGIAACRMHRVDPGSALVAALDNHLPGLRVEALRSAGALGRVDLLERVRQGMSDDAPEVVFWAAWAACLLGDRQGALRVLEVAARQDTPWAHRALSLTMAAAPFKAAAEFVHQLFATAQGQVDDAAASRRLLRAVGLLGDVRFVPWLIERMAEPAFARLSAESFCWICGTDFATQDLQRLGTRRPSQEWADDAKNDGVAPAGDEGLAWPDPAPWWQHHRSSLADAGRASRLFAGEPVSVPAARRVLRDGTQPLRAHAAELLCVLQPGTALFPVAAPAPRQLRWLTGSR